MTREELYYDEYYEEYQIPAEELDAIKSEAYQKGRADAYKTFAEVIALDIADCSRCPIDCDVATYGDCEKELIAYVKEQSNDRL